MSNLNPADVGTCEIWGWSYHSMAGNRASFIGGPYPTSDILNIKNGSNQSLNVNIELYDISGRRVYTNTAELNTTLQINVSAFEGGVYLLNVTDKNNNIAITKRVIKR